MSVGLDTLYKAAQYIEQQDNLNLSARPAAPTITINEHTYIVHRAPAATHENVAVPTAVNGGHSSSNNNNIVNGGSTGRNSNTRHISQVSSSAPAAAATFHHANGLTITSSVNNPLGTMAAAAACHSNDYEFSNGNIIVAGAPITNGRCSDIRNITEEPFSSNVVTSSDSTSPNSNSSSFVLLPASTRTSEQQIRQQQQITFATATHKQQQHNNNSSKTKPTTTFTLIDNNNAVTAAASKQMLLNGGVRIASPAATIGIGASNKNSTIVAAKVISITPPQQPQQQSQTVSSSYPLYNPPMQRHKKCNPLTPPPMPSRKFVETNPRIRSFSLSSHKFTAVAGSAAGSPHQLLLQHNNSDDSHMMYVSGGSSGNSPPRQVTGSHYIQMMSSGAGSQASQPTPLIGGTGRRRTISSNSNGAGTRETHNKLEKNRRAQLKECYDQLKHHLRLRNEDRKKTSNLTVLVKALNLVSDLKREHQELEEQVDQLAKKKINSQKKFVSLKRELGPKYQQYFAGILPDIEFGSIPVERETLNDSGSLSSGRGSLLYSSSSSLSSGGSSSNNTVSSPTGAGQSQSAMPTVLSPVISQQMTTNATASSSCVTTTASAATSPISPNMLLQQMKSASTSSTNSVAGSPHNGVGSHGSPTIVNVTMPLSLTAKNISATSLTRGSPTPSTPSPSPSSASSMSSSSSIISSSPPALMNGVINGRNVTLNIPNGLKFQTSIAGNAIGTLSNGTAATIIATAAAAPAGANSAAGNVSSSNNAIMLQAFRGCHLV